MRRVCLLLWAACLALPAAGDAQGRPFTLDDLGRLESVRSPVISPDARHVVYTVSRPDFETNRTETRVLLLDVASRTSSPIASDRSAVRALAWVDNDRLAFVARGDSAGAGQVFLWDRATGFSRQVTHAPSGVRAFAVAPDGRSVAYSTDDAPTPKQGPERFNDAFEVGNDDYLTMLAPQGAHLWIQPLDGGSANRLTSGPASLATSLATSPIAWLPDGSGVIVQLFASPHSGDTDRSRIARVTVPGGALTLLTGGRARADGPRVSPDGRWITFGSPRDGIPANQRDVHVIPAGGGEPRNLSRTLDRAVAADWLPDGSMLWIGPDGTRVSMWLATTGARVERIPTGTLVVVSSPSVAGDGTIAFLGTDRNRPEEVYLLPPGDSIPVRLTDHNAFLTGRAAGRTIGIEWRTPDGFTTDGVVTYPPGFDPGRRYPLVLFIHGGPTAASHEGFSTRVALLAAEGWIVFQPNYRGSNNRGNAFQRAIADDPGPGIDRDVMSGVQALVRRGGVDTTRIGVSGWSFGGYVTAWLIGHHRNWKAAIVGAGAMDLFDMYALTDLNVQLRHAITTSPYVGNREAWFDRQSPLTYASRVRTPTLILHDVRDQRVTITQSYKLFHALRDNGVPVQFIAYPVAGHSPTDPVRSRDVHRRWIEWFARQFSGARLEAGGSSLPPRASRL